MSCAGVEGGGGGQSFVLVGSVLVASGGLLPFVDCGVGQFDLGVVPGVMFGVGNGV